ncbi:hypothetical protein, partial [Alicyclobacillus acidiphilus]|uniref:hypothetical protein n=1 Tax=Alicyclobacillus acidiphilus TaxID=182455 RepID=UPI0028935687
SVRPEPGSNSQSMCSLEHRLASARLVSLAWCVFSFQGTIFDRNALLSKQLNQYTTDDNALSPGTFFIGCSREMIG